MREEEKLLQKRFRELENQAYRNDTFCFTNFLSLADVNILYDSVDEKQFEIFGGMEGCERVIARFGNKDELGYEVPYPITILKVEPLIEKFADPLSHRDFLGALMNLGIEREMIGDIRIDGKSAYVFVIDSMAEYIMQSLDKVKHTSVRVIRLSEVPADVTVRISQRELVVSSKRIDVVIAGVYKLSRSKVLDLFREKKVFVKGRTLENNSYLLKEEDVIAVRGFGKFIYKKENHETRKGRLCLTIGEYV